MIKQLALLPSTSALCWISTALLAEVLSGSAAQAQTTLLTSAPKGSTAATTAAYPTGDALHFISGPFTVMAGSRAVTYTAETEADGSPAFESFDNYDGSLDFPVPTQLIATFDSADPTGPLWISFSSGVSAFGIRAESQASDITAFSFTAYDGLQSIGQYTLSPVDQTDGTSHSVFLGAQAPGNALITSVEIRSGTDDFYVGPLSIYTAPVPEAGTLVSFSLLLGLGLGARILVRKKSGHQAELMEK